MQSRQAASKPQGKRGAKEVGRG